MINVEGKGYNIYPGKGVLNILLRDSWESVMGKISGNFEIESRTSVSGKLYYPVLLKLKGIEFYFHSENISHILRSTDELEFIVLNHNFRGITINGIKMYSNVTEVKKFYGEPDFQDQQNRYIEYSQGIGFSYNRSSEIENILIMHPY